MKKAIFIASLSFCSILLPAQQLPADLIQTFEQNFPRVRNPEWMIEKDFYRVTYMDSLGMRQTAIFDKNGKFEMRYYALSDVLVPSDITVYLSRSYPGFENYTVFRMIDDQETVLNFVNNDNETIFFDRTGKFYRKVPLDLKTVEKTNGD